MHSILNTENWIGSLPLDVQSLLQEQMQSLAVAAGETFTKAGEAATAMYQVESGYLRLIGLQEDGRQVLITIYGPGACFAETALVAQRPLNHSTVAMTAAHVRCLPAAAFWRLYQQHRSIPDELCRKFANTVSRQVAAREARAADRLGKRIATMFSGLASDCGKRSLDGSVRVSLPITQTDIAEYFDVTRQSIQREMTAMKHAGLVAKVDGAWQIYDLGRLQAAV